MNIFYPLEKFAGWIVYDILLVEKNTLQANILTFLFTTH